MTERQTHLDRHGPPRRRNRERKPKVAPLQPHEVDCACGQPAVAAPVLALGWSTAEIVAHAPGRTPLCIACLRAAVAKDSAEVSHG